MCRSSTLLIAESNTTCSRFVFVGSVWLSAKTLYWGLEYIGLTFLTQRSV